RMREEPIGDRRDRDIADVDLLREDQVGEDPERPREDRELDRERAAVRPLGRPGTGRRRHPAPEPAPRPIRSAAVSTGVVAIARALRPPRAGSTRAATRPTGSPRTPSGSVAGTPRRP